MIDHLTNIYNNLYNYLPFQIVENNYNNKEVQENYFYLSDGNIVKESRIIIYENGTKKEFYDRQIGNRTYREIITNNNNNDLAMIVKYTRGINPNIRDINLFIGEFQNLMENKRNQITN